jgi:hypothetical protein
VKLIWQREEMLEQAWISEILGPYIDEEIFDGQHKVVLDNCVVADSYLHARPAEYFAQFRGKRAWLIHFSDETYEGGYQHYSNFKGVLRNHWSSIFDTPSILQFPLGYAEGLMRNPLTLETTRRQYLWSFAGAAGKSSRPDMIRALSPMGPFFTLITDGPVADEPLDREAYLSILSDSVFAPCPMGNVNLDSYRIYEALECGSIPILEKRITLDYFTRLLGPHPIPTFRSWTKAAAFMAKLRNDGEGLRRLQAECFSWWSAYKEKLRANIGDFLSATAERHDAPRVRWRYSIPGWQAAELLRHHSLAAAGRRVKRQTDRIVKGKKLRITEGR